MQQMKVKKRGHRLKIIKRVCLGAGGIIVVVWLMGPLLRIWQQDRWEYVFESYAKQGAWDEAYTFLTGISRKNLNKKNYSYVLYLRSKILCLYLHRCKEGLHLLGEHIPFNGRPKEKIFLESFIAQMSFDILADYERARFFYKKLSSYIPHSKRYAFYIYRLALSEYALTNYSEARKNFGIVRQLRSQWGEDAFDIQESLYYMGVISFIQGDYVQAKQELKGYLSLTAQKRSVSKAKFFLANIDERQKKYSFAQERYMGLLHEFPNKKLVERRLFGLSLLKSAAY